MTYYDDPLIAALAELPFERLDNLFSLHHAVRFATRAQQSCGVEAQRVPDDVRGATLAVAVLVALFSDRLDVDDSGRALIWSDNSQLHSSSIRPGYRMHLAADVGLRAVVRHQFSRALLNDDDEGPAPGEDMTFFRFHAAHCGLLEQLRIWAEDLIESDECNQGDGINDDVPTPEDLLQRIHDLIEEATDLFTVRDVMCA